MVLFLACDRLLDIDLLEGKHHFERRGTGLILFLCFSSSQLYRSDPSFYEGTEPGFANVNA